MLMVARHLPASVLEPLAEPLGWMYWLVLAALIARVVFIGGKWWTEKHTGVLESSSGPELVATLIAAVVVGSAPQIASMLLGE